VLRAATAYGGEAFGGKPMGQIKTGYLADLILVDGDPLADLRLLQDRDRLVAIMLGGEFHKRPIHGRDLRMAAPPER
jgi:imidazolonepropionase-like amidohydrolase